MHVVTFADKSNRNCKVQLCIDALVCTKTKQKQQRVLDWSCASSNLQTMNQKIAAMWGTICCHATPHNLQIVNKTWNLLLACAQVCQWSVCRPSPRTENCLFRPCEAKCKDLQIDIRENESWMLVVVGFVYTHSSYRTDNLLNSVSGFSIATLSFTWQSGQQFSHDGGCEDQCRQHSQHDQCELPSPYKGNHKTPKKCGYQLLEFANFLTDCFLDKHCVTCHSSYHLSCTGFFVKECNILSQDCFQVVASYSSCLPLPSDHPTCDLYTKFCQESHK